MNKIKVVRASRAGWGTVTWRVYNSQWNMNEFIDETDAQKLLSLVNKIQDKMPTLNKSNILIDKNSDVPRPKMKEFISDNGHKKVTLLSKADVVFVRRESVKMIQKWLMKEVMFLDPSDCKKISPQTNEQIMLDTNSNQDQEYLDVQKRCTTKKGWLIENYRNRKQNECIDFLFSLIGTKATLIYDDVLNKSLNADGIDLDNEIYDTLESMLLSKDNDTFKLGIEMLGNVNLEESNLFKVSLLMNNVFNRTRRFTAMSQYQSKNFKSLLNYLQVNNIQWNKGWENYGFSMWAKFKDTSYAPNIKKFIIDNLNAKYKNQVGEIVEITDIILR